MRRLALAATLCSALASPAPAQERFPRIPPEQMTPEQKALADARRG